MTNATPTFGPKQGGTQVGGPSIFSILALFYPPLKQIWGCLWLCLQAQEGDIYFTELAERVEYGNYALITITATIIRRTLMTTSISPKCNNYHQLFSTATIIYD